MPNAVSSWAKPGCSCGSKRRSNSVRAAGGADPGGPGRCRRQRRRGPGGGIQVNTATVYLEFPQITGNEAVGGRSGTGGRDGEGFGGGVYILPKTLSSVYARFTEITGNFASTSHDDVFGDLFEL